MLMSDIIQRFRDENPEIDANVISDATLMSWCFIADQEICTKVRLINIEDVKITITPGQNTYNLSSTNVLFFDISENPGGGICQWPTNTNYKRLTKVTKSWLDFNNSQWRVSSQGVPKYYYRSGQNIVIYPTPNSSITKLTADLILLSNSFNNLSITPYNQLPYLAPFHYAIVLYLQWRAKIKIGKDAESVSAFQLYDAYIQWMIKTVGGGKYGPIQFKPGGLPSIGFQR